MRLKRVASAALLVAAPHLCAVTLSADSFLYVALEQGGQYPWFARTTLIELPIIRGTIGAIQRQVFAAGSLSGRPVTSFDGRYIAWMVSTGIPGAVRTDLMYLDRSSGATGVLPDISASGLFAAPDALRFYVQRGADELLVIEPTNIRPVRLAGTGYALFVKQALRNHRLLALLTVYGVPRSSTAIVELDASNATAGVRGILEDSTTASLTDIAVSGDGNRLYVLHGYDLRLIDFNSRQVSASRQPPASTVYRGFEIDETFGRVLVQEVSLSGSGNWDVPRVVALDPLSLAPLPMARHLALLPSLHADPSEAMAVALTSVRSGGFVCESATTAETWLTAEVPFQTLTADTGGACAFATMATPPNAPVVLTARVDGRRVSLSWSNVPGTTGFELEAGSRTGLSDLARLSTPSAPELVVNEVPSGTYYVRVRARNHVGVGPASPEAMIVVP